VDSVAGFFEQQRIVREEQELARHRAERTRLEAGRQERAAEQAQVVFERNGSLGTRCRQT
jgi:hypothetical protein